MTGEIRIYIDVSSIEEALRQAAEENNEVFEGLDISRFKAYESPSKGGAYAFIAEIDYDPTKDYIEIDSTQYTDKTYWFKVSWIDSVEVESELSEPILGEDMNYIISLVATALGDVERDDEDTQAFTDEEYITKIRGAVRRYKGESIVSALYEHDMEPIILLVRISCCYDLAYDNAKYSSLSLPDGIALNKGERVEHYLSIAKSLEKHYEQLLDDLGGTTEDGSLSGTPSLEVVKATKETYFSGLRLPPRR
jgi:hypothetical protein